MRSGNARLAYPAGTRVSTVHDPEVCIRHENPVHTEPEYAGSQVQLGR